MRDRDPAQPPLGATSISGDSPTADELREFRRKHCAYCGGPFGLTRRQRGGKQFCSAQCVAEYTRTADNEASARPHWYTFLFQHR